MSKIKNVSTTWFAPGFDKSVICPVDGCGHAGNYISKVHCRFAHNMTRDEVQKKYGYPEITNTKGKIVSDNNPKRWNSVAIEKIGF